MATLRLFIKESDKPNRVLTGDIWPKGAPDTDPPVVAGVTLRMTEDREFELSAGDYVYFFTSSLPGTFVVAIELASASPPHSAPYKVEPYADVTAGEPLAFSFKVK